jgi:hypothetical protein
LEGNKAFQMKKSSFFVAFFTREGFFSAKNLGVRPQYRKKRSNDLIKKSKKKFRRWGFRNFLDFTEKLLLYR